MTVIEALEQLGATIDQCEDPRSMALFALGVAIGTAMKHGISAVEIASFDAMREVALVAAHALVKTAGLEPKATATKRK